MNKKIKKIIIIILLSFIPNINATTKAPIDITNMNIEKLSNALDKEIITSYQLVNIYLERIEKYDKNYNSINQINKNAINEAQQLDKERSKGKVRSKLHGIPIVVKTNIDVKGLATTAGAKALSDNYPKEDAEIIKNLKEAGAIILASTNMSEFAYLASSSTSSYGTVKNAYNNNYSSYGSSGGTAVAVALSFASAGIGTDTNSSIRVPSSANNLFGFRPSFGSINMQGILPYDKYRDVAGPMTKSVIDSAIIMDVITNKNKNINYEQIIKNTTLKDKKIGIIKEFYNGSDNASLRINGKSYEGIVKLMDEQIEKLKQAGAQIKYIDNFMNQTYYDIIFGTMSGFTICDTFNEYIKNTNSKIKNFNDLNNSNQKIYDLNRYAQSCGKSNEKYTKSFETRKKKYLKYVEETIKKNNVDVLLYPTVKNELQKLNESNEGTLSTPSTYISSTTGLPAVNVPMGFYKNLPYGMEFTSGQNQEALLFEIISAYENINNFYSLPDEVPSLYDIDNSITKLTKEYIDFLNKEVSILLKYKKNRIINEIKEFYKNYNSTKNEKNISKSKELYTKIIEIQKENIKTNKIIKSLFTIIVIIFTLILSLKIKKYKNKRRRKKQLKSIKH